MDTNTTMPSPTFRIGDHVRFREGGPARIWTVIANVTGEPHAVDHEPAYQLEYRSTDGLTLATRAAYQSDIERAD